MQGFETCITPALAEDTHLAILVVEKGRLIGAGGVSFYQVMPTYHNPSGKKAYIMNMYTDPDHRRQGIAYKTLDILVQASKERGIHQITLEATDMGKSLYEKYGFVQMGSEMELVQGRRPGCTLMGSTRKRRAQDVGTEPARGRYTLDAAMRGR